MHLISIVSALVAFANCKTEAKPFVADANTPLLELEHHNFLIHGPFSFLTDRIVGIYMGLNDTQNFLKAMPDSLRPQTEQFVVSQVRQVLFYACDLKKMHGKEGSDGVSIFLMNLENGNSTFSSLPGILRWLIKGSVDNAITVYCSMWKWDGQPHKFMKDLPPGVAGQVSGVSIPGPRPEIPQPSSEPIPDIE